MIVKCTEDEGNDRISMEAFMACRAVAFVKKEHTRDLAPILVSFTQGVIC